MRRAVLMASLLALASVHCGRGMYAPGKAAQNGSAPASSAPAKPFDFNAEMKKESSGLRTMAIAAPDGSFTATVSASSTPKVTPSENESFTVAFDIGATRPMDCAVFKSRIDPASTAYKLAYVPLEKMPTKEVLGIELGADDDRPVLSFVMAAVDAAKEAYVMKLTVVMLPERSVVCRHEEIGYAATAKAVTLELARTLKSKDPPRDVRYHDLMLVKVGGTAIGWNERQFFDGEDGATFEMSSGVTFAAKGAEMIADDEVTVVETDREGLVKRVTKGEGTPKGLAKRLVLERRGPTDYEVDGEIEGNKVHTRLKSKKPLRGGILFAQDIVSNARAPKATPLVEESWLARTPPGEISTSTYTRATPFDPNAPAYVVKSDDDEARMTLDAQGLLTRLEGKIQDVPVEATRLFAKGTLKRSPRPSK